MLRGAGKRLFFSGQLAAKWPPFPHSLHLLLLVDVFASVAQEGSSYVNCSTAAARARTSSYLSNCGNMYLLNSGPCNIVCMNFLKMASRGICNPYAFSVIISAYFWYDYPYFCFSMSNSAIRVKASFPKRDSMTRQKSSTCSSGHSSDPRKSLACF